LSELSLLKDIQHEPLAQFAVIVLVVYKLIDVLIKNVPNWLAKEKIMPLKEWQTTVIKNIEAIQSELKQVLMTLSTHDFLLNKTSEGTLTNQLFTETLSPFIRLKAFRRLLAMGKNGRIWEKGLLLIVENREYVKDKDGKNICVKDVWLDVLDTDLGIEIVDIAYYEARLKEIRRRIYDDFSEK